MVLGPGPAEFVIILLILAQWLIPIVLIVLGIRWVLRWNENHRAANPPIDPALAVLRDRFARGEIDAAEYEERRRTLGD
jgi:putative membrane protein